MNSQRLRELEMINACRHDSQDIQVYESNLDNTLIANRNCELEQIADEIINYQYRD